MAPVAAAAAAAAAAAPKVGAAFVVGSTSFLHVPDSLADAIHRFVSAEHAGYHWIHDKVFGPSPETTESAAAVNAVVQSGLPGTGIADHNRLVTYYSLGCPHCHDFAPVWKDALGQWKATGGKDVAQVDWDSRECYDEDWKPAKDYKDCEANEIEGFPAVRFYPAGSKEGVDFEGERTAEGLLAFLQQQLHPGEAVQIGNVAKANASTAAGGDLANHPGHAAVAPQGYRFVDYFAGGCPHCKQLAPTWDAAQQQWQNAAGNDAVQPTITWEKKECYDNNWTPGADHKLCKSEHVGAFPTIRLYKPGAMGAQQQVVDYTGPRTPEAMIDFLKHQTASRAANAESDTAHVNGTANGHKDAHDAHEAGAPPVAGPESNQGQGEHRDLDDDADDDADLDEDGSAGPNLGGSNRDNNEEERDETEEATAAAQHPSEDLPMQRLGHAVHTAMAPMGLAVFASSCIPMPKRLRDASRKVLSKPRVPPPGHVQRFM